MKKRVILQLSLQLHFPLAIIIYNFIYFYTLCCIIHVALVAMDTLYSYMESYIIENMCNSMQLGCLHRSLMQIDLNECKSNVTFHWSIDKQSLLMSIAINLQFPIQLFEYHYITSFPCFPATRLQLFYICDVHFVKCLPLFCCHGTTHDFFIPPDYFWNCNNLIFNLTCEMMSMTHR